MKYAIVLKFQNKLQRILSILHIKTCIYIPYIYIYMIVKVKVTVQFSRPEYQSGQLFLSPEDLPNPGIKPRSPTLQTDSLPTEPPGNLQTYEPALVKNLHANAGDLGLIPGLGISPGVGNYMYRRAWQATVHGVSKESDRTQQPNNNYK